MLNEISAMYVSHLRYIYKSERNFLYMDCKEVLQQVKKELRENNFSELTLLNYCFFIEKFLQPLEKSSDAVSADDIQNYLSQLIQGKSDAILVFKRGQSNIPFK